MKTKNTKKPVLRPFLFQPRLRHTYLLNGSRGKDPIAAGKK